MDSSVKEYLIDIDGQLSDLLTSEESEANSLDTRLQKLTAKRDEFGAEIDKMLSLPSIDLDKLEKMMYDYFELIYTIDEVETQYRIAQETIALVAMEEI